MPVQQKNQSPVRDLRRKILHALAGLLLIICFHAISARGQTMPRDLTIELVSAPNVAGGPFGLESIAIASDGTVRLSRRDSYAGPLPETTIVIDAAALSRLYRAITDNDFFTLKSRYNDPAIDDGDYAKLTITAHGKTHSVRTVNIRVTAFDQIALAINREMPDGRRVLYNALHIDDYMEVER